MPEMATVEITASAGAPTIAFREIAKWPRSWPDKVRDGIDPIERPKEKDGHKVARATAPGSLQSFFCLLTNGLVLITELIRGCRQKPAMCG